MNLIIKLLKDLNDVDITIQEIIKNIYFTHLNNNYDTLYLPEKLDKQNNGFNFTILNNSNTYDKDIYNLFDNEYKIKIKNNKNKITILDYTKSISNTIQINNKNNNEVEIEFNSKNSKINKIHCVFLNNKYYLSLFGYKTNILNNRNNTHIKINNVITNTLHMKFNRIIKPLVDFYDKY